MPAQVPADRLRGIGGVAGLCLGAVFVLFSVWACASRGPWYDEFFTYFVSRPGIGWKAALLDHWLADNHPPLFYALARANPFGGGIEGQRLINLIFAGIVAGGLFLLGRNRPEWHLPLLVFAMGLVASPEAIFFSAELRSNFMAYAFAALSCAALAVIAGPEHAARETAAQNGPLPSGAASVLLAAAMMLAFNTHLAATVLAGGVAATFWLRLVLARQWRKAAWLAALGLAAVLPLLITLAVQLPRIEANTRSFWIPAGFDAARWAILAQLQGVATANVPLTLFGVVGLAALARQRWEGIRSAHLDLALTLVAGAALGTLVLLMLHMWRPIIITRYLVALEPPIYLALALGAAHVLTTFRQGAAKALLIVLALGSMTGMVRSYGYATAEPSWNGTAAFIAGRLTAKGPGSCGDAVVHADLTWNRPVMAMPPHDDEAVMPMAYAMTARAHGFALEPQGSRRMGRNCTLFWTEHVADVEMDKAKLAAALRRQGFRIKALELHRIGRGWVAISRPAR